MRHLERAGRYCFGTAVAGSGLMQVINAEFVRLIPPLPAWAPPAAALAGAVGVVLMLIGAAIVTGYRLRMMTGLLAALLITSFVVQRLGELAPAVGAWINPLKVLALAAGAVLLGGHGGRWPGVAALALGSFLLVCGWAHFVFADFVDALVPAWIPPGARFWTYFSAIALLAGGVGILVPRTRRDAALWSGVMVFLWVWLLHVPRSVELRSAFELAGVFEALALAGVAWLVAGRSVEEPAGSRTTAAVATGASVSGQ